MVTDQRFTLSLGAKTVAHGCSKGNAIEPARLIKDSAFQRRSPGATKMKVCARLSSRVYSYQPLQDSIFNKLTFIMYIELFHYFRPVIVNGFQANKEHISYLTASAAISD